MFRPPRRNLLILLPLIMLFNYFFTLYLSLVYTVNYFYLFAVLQTCNITITYQCKILIVPEEGWFGQPKYIVHLQKNPSTLSTFASIFFINLVNGVRLHAFFYCRFRFLHSLFCFRFSSGIFFAILPPVYLVYPAYLRLQGLSGGILLICSLQ